VRAKTQDPEHARRSVEASLDKDWLLGESRWWPANEGRPPLLRDGEIEPSEPWITTDAVSGGRGWMRQRLQPAGSKILLPTSWSLFFLISTVFPLAFPDKTPIDDQNLAIVLFSIAWILTLVPILSMSDGLENRARKKFDVYPFAFLPFLFGVMIFVLHIIIDSRLGWISYLCFLYSWALTISNLAQSVKPSSGRWLLPIKVEDVNLEILADGWERKSKVFRNGLIASWSEILDDYSADLVGISHGKHRFIAIVLRHRSGLIHDIFTSNFVENKLFTEIISKPPLTISGDAWPSNFIINFEEE
jgi:hypothetical protein